MVETTDIKYLAAELKMPQDLIGSLQPDPETGECHLSTQRRNCPYAFRVAVLGSLGDVMRAMSTADVNGRRGDEAMLRCLPGVGPETARAMLEEHIVPWIGCENARGEMWSVSEERLMEIPGIGKKKAAKILEALR
ncbi:MAG: helix-hairpin-helix domain-containing protein [Methanothrix sp.]